MTNAVSHVDDDVVNTVFSFESYRQYLLVLPAGGVFQTEPPGGCLRQALDLDRVVTVSTSLYKMVCSFEPSLCCSSFSGIVMILPLL